jgi:hypothetical protein
MSEVTSIQLEDQLQAARKANDLLTQHDRLLNNKDFREVILTEFLVNEAARYVQLSQDPALTDKNQEDSLNIAVATGHVKRWLAVRRQMLQHQVNSVPQLESELDALRAEEAQE